MTATKKTQDAEWNELVMAAFQKMADEPADGIGRAGRTPEQELNRLALKVCFRDTVRQGLSLDIFRDWFQKCFSAEKSSALELVGSVNAALSSYATGEYDKAESVRQIGALLA